MKKRVILGFLMTAILILTSVSFAFAETEKGIATAPAVKPQSSFADVTGTKYEAAVNTLVQAGIIQGYPDGTFRPERAVSRAEMAKMTVLVMGGGDANADAASLRFSDVTETAWYMPYVTTMTKKAILNGYPDGTFRPEKTITYNEAAKILVASLGYAASDLKGSWPDNYMNKANDLGITQDLPTPINGNAPAIRGDIACMIDRAFYDSRTPEDPEETPESDPSELMNYGCVYGLIDDICQLKNQSGSNVYAIEFLLGQKRYTIPAYNTAGSNAIAALINTNLHDGTLYALQLKKGEVATVATAETAASCTWIKTLSELTPSKTIQPEKDGFVKVYSIDNAGILFKDKRTEAYDAVDLGSKVIVYKLNGEDEDYSYETATLSAVYKNTLIRLYDVTKDKNDEANVIIIDDRD